jgi:hypothetical protein
VTVRDLPPDEVASGFVIATYREIAARFGLGSVGAARNRAKRTRWEHEPANHPLDQVRVRVPLTAWERVPPERSRSPSGERPLSHPRSEGHEVDNPLPVARPRSETIKTLADAVVTLREQLEEERRRVAQVQAERDQARQTLSAAQAQWESRLDGLTADMVAERRAHLTDREKLQAELRAAREAREAGLEAMAADLTEIWKVANKEAEARARAELELKWLRSRPWWRRLLGAG